MSYHLEDDGKGLVANSFSGVRAFQGDYSVITSLEITNCLSISAPLQILSQFINLV